MEVEPRVLPDSARTAPEAAAAVGVPVGAIVKSLVFRCGDEAVLALVSGANRADERRLEAELGAAVSRADADFARAATGFSIGGVPPLGHPAPLRTLVDEDLLSHPVVWAAAGTPHAVFPIEPAALADPTRRQVNRSLAGEQAVTASGLAGELPMSRQAVATHLVALERAGLVAPRREGRETRYRLTPEPLGDAIAWMEEVGARWDRSLAKLSERARRG